MKINCILISCLLFLVSCAVPHKTDKKETTVDINSPQYKLEEARITLSTGDFQSAGHN